MKLNPTFIKFWGERVYRQKMFIEDVPADYQQAVLEYISENYPSN